MLFPNKIKTIAFAVLLPASIPYLHADTNAPEIKIEDVAPLATTPLSQITATAENLEMAMGMVFDTQTKQGQALVEALMPLSMTLGTLKTLPDTASDAEIFQAFDVLKQVAVYLGDIIEKGAEKLEPFHPKLSAVSQANPAELEAADAALQLAVAALDKKIGEAYQDAFANMLMHVRRQLDQLDGVLQTIYKKIAEKSTLINKEDVKNEIRELRSTLTQIRKELAGAQASPEIVLTVLQVNKVVIDYLANAQRHKFREWSMVDLTKAFKRSQSDMQANMLDDVFVQIAQTNMALAELEKESEKIDLTFVNKTARFIGDNIIDPINRHDLITWGIAGGATIGLAVYVAYYFDNTFFTNPDSIFRKLFGFPNHMINKMLSMPSEKLIATLLKVKNIDPHSFNEAQLQEVVDSLTLDDYKQATILLESLVNQAKRNTVQPYIPLAKFDEFISNYRSGTAAIGAALFVGATYAYNKILARHGHEWTKKIYVWFEKLKGGAIAKNAEKYEEILGSSITFDDVIGMEYEKEQVIPHLKYIKDPERWDANELTPPTGILLTGPTRTGKTFFAKAICGELHKQNPEKTLRFFTINAHDIKAEGIDNIMRMAKFFAPCVLFIDEIDLLGLQRDKERVLLADFLQALSGITDKDPKKQVIVIGTTNKPESIDTAMLQSGRLALEIRFKYPSLKERANFIQKRLEKFGIEPDIFDIDVLKLARETEGKSFEDIKLMLDMAFIHIGIKGTVISQDILEWSLDSQLRRIIDIDSKEIAADEQQLLAAHYAGQTLCHLLLDLDEKIAKVTTKQIVVKVKEEAGFESFWNPDHKKQTGLEHGALFTYHEHDCLDIKKHSENELIKKAKTLIAGKIAERMLTGNASILFGNKRTYAFNIVKQIASEGIDMKSLSKSGQNKVSDDAQAMLKQLDKEVEELLASHKAQLQALADAFGKYHTLTIDEINQIINPQLVSVEAAAA